VALLLAVVLGVNAQDASTSSDAPKYMPEAGDFSGAILFGRGAYFTGGLFAPGSPSSGSWTVPGTAPSNNIIDGNSNDITNMVGGEARYFVTSMIAVKLSGGAILRNTPAVDNLPGIIDSNSPNAAWIPAYQATAAENSSDININIGGEYHFATKYDRLSPWAGLNLPIYYGRRSAYDPTIDDAGNVTDVGLRHTELVGFGVQAAAGVDYYLMEGFYIGFEFKPISFVAAKTTKLPAPGLEGRDAGNTTLSFFSQPFFKIGFRF
jgi:outer membrane protein W